MAVRCAGRKKWEATCVLHGSGDWELATGHRDWRLTVDDAMRRSNWTTCLLFNQSFSLWQPWDWLYHAHIQPQPQAKPHLSQITSHGSNSTELFTCLLQVRSSPHCVYAAYAACRLSTLDSRQPAACGCPFCIWHFCAASAAVAAFYANEAKYCYRSNILFAGSALLGPGSGFRYRSNVYPFSHTTAKSACC